jgi:antitoxin (DNA-binding transcriptional repressor) of toxin-antitoxin stability system
MKSARGKQRLARPSAYLRRVRAGEIIAVTNRGKLVEELHLAQQPPRTSDEIEEVRKSPRAGGPGDAVEAS